MKRKFLFIISLIVVVLFVLTRDSDNTDNVQNFPKQKSIFGSYLSPRNFPDSIIRKQKADIDEYFNLNREVGSHTAILLRWDDPAGLYKIYDSLMERARKEGFKFYLHWDPLTEMTHAAPAPPKSLGATSFGDPKVREAYIEAVLDLAAKKPDLLGIGTEVNLMLLHGNPAEYEHFKSLAKEAYSAIKAKYPNQLVTISFSWDVVRIYSQYRYLNDFKDSADILSFTTYPNAFDIPFDRIMGDYYSSIRRYLPNEKVAISEIGWYSGNTPEIQAEFYKRLPNLLKDLKPEFVTQFFMFDLPDKYPVEEKFKSLGFIKSDGQFKPSWEVVKNYDF